MVSFALTFLLVFAFWMLLSGQTSPLLLTLGVISSLLVAFWSHDLLIGRNASIGQGFLRFLRLLKYIPWLIWQIVLANINVLYLTLHPKMPIEPEVITFNTDLKTDFGVFVLANSITLTPGTVTIEATHKEFIVHAITPDAAAGIPEMEARVKEIEGQNV